MVSLSKSLLVSVLSVGGIGATAFGVNAKPYSDFLNWRNRKVNTSEPVILCENEYEKYESFIDISENGKNDRGLGLTFRFKITDKFQENKTWIREWGENATHENNGWEAWKIAFSGNKVDILLNAEYGTTNNRFTSDYAPKGCDKSKIELKDPTQNQNNEEGIEDKDIRFEVEKDKCTQGFGHVTCDIIFKSDSNLKWREGFKPTITFY